MNSWDPPGTMAVWAVAIWFVVNSNEASEPLSVSTQSPKSLASIGMLQECIVTNLHWHSARLNKHLPQAGRFFLCPSLFGSNAVFTCDKSPFLKVLTDAEMAANAAAIQLVSFKDAMEDEFDVCFIYIFTVVNQSSLSKWKQSNPLLSLRIPDLQHLIKGDLWDKGDSC